MDARSDACGLKHRRKDINDEGVTKELAVFVYRLEAELILALRGSAEAALFLALDEEDRG